MIHLGLFTCSYNFLKAGAILFVSVPEINIKSACRGEALKITPNRSKSYLLNVACIISTAQHANPNVKGQKEPLRTQLIKDKPGITT